MTESLTTYLKGDFLYVCPYCGSHDLYFATWTRMNPPKGEELCDHGDVCHPDTRELLPAWCSTCSRDIHGSDYVPLKARVPPKREEWEPPF